MTQTAQHTAIPFNLPLRVNGSEVTTSVWVEDANGARALTVKASDRDADQCNYATKAINSHDALVKTLKFILRGIEGGHIKCAPYFDFDPNSTAAQLEFKSPASMIRDALTSAGAA